MSRRILIWVQHLLGTGHVRRAAAIARALATGGDAVRVASGGRPVADIDWGNAEVHQLPPMASADQTFSALVDGGGKAIDQAWRARRTADLLALFADFAPHVLITETYPFGRRMMRFEVEPLLAAAWRQRPRPLILSSIRDILHAGRKPSRIAETVDVVRARYDRVLIHGDPALVTLEASFPAAAEIADYLHYTGYVADDPVPLTVPGSSGGVVVSAGGGAVGRRLLETALTARAMTSLADRPWRLLAGGNLPGSDFDRLRAKAGADVIVERARPDFIHLLAAADLSISQAGYNTVLDLLRARCRAVLVPFAGEGETEQPLRARLMAERGWAEVVAEADLTPVALAAAVDRAIVGEPPVADEIAMNGAVESARLIAGWAGPAS